ncbi:MAG: hypothetical protein LBK29_04775 [Oscillospiraceae bacterium]|nr:hypothetical protein [Oscillospiraceae bacterium]
MRTYNKNAAYDLSKFENQTQRKIIDITKAKKVRDSRARIMSIMFTSGMILAIFAGSFFFLLGQVRMTELTARISQTSKELSDIDAKKSEILAKKIQKQSSESNSEAMFVHKEDKAEIFDESSA